MIVIVCLDHKNGMMFNRRRQSRDRFLCRRVLELTKGRVLRMNRYSANQFDGMEIPHASISETFLQEASDGEYCFVENNTLRPYEANMEALIVFRWNKTYPSDVRLDLDLERAWKLVHREEFSGYSHDIIGMEVYKR